MYSFFFRRLSCAEILFLIFLLIFFRLRSSILESGSLSGTLYPSDTSILFSSSVSFSASSLLGPFLLPCASASMREAVEEAKPLLWLVVAMVLLLGCTSLGLVVETLVVAVVRTRVGPVVRLVHV